MANSFINKDIIISYTNICAIKHKLNISELFYIKNTTKPKYY